MLSIALNAYECLLSSSKVFLKRREYDPLYKTKLDRLLDLPRFLEENFTEEQRDVYNKTSHFIENCTPLKIYANEVNKILCNDVTSVCMSFLHPSSFPQKDRVMMIKGAAGTGKTFVISGLIAKLVQDLGDGEMIYVIAPTHKAKKIISSKIYQMLRKLKAINLSNRIVCQTISRFLDQEPVYDKDGNSVFRTRVDHKKLEDLRYLFIDEASMINMEDWDNLKEYVINKLPKMSAVVLGDEYQLPPVGDTTSYVIKDIKNTLTMKKIVRAKTACMVKMYQTFRGFVNKRSVKIPDELERNGCMTRTHRLSEYITENFNPKIDKILTYSNNSVDSYNKMVREKLYGEDVPRFVDGDILVFNGIAKVFKPSPFIFYTNDEVEVISMEETRLTMKDVIKIFPSNYRPKLKTIFPDVSFKIYKLSATYFHNVFTFNIIHENSEMKFKNYFKRARTNLKTSCHTDGVTKSELWGMYWDIQRYFNCPLKYSYALTIYKSQGSTYRHAYIDARNIANCIQNKSKSQYVKTLYTAVTRATDKIFYADLLPIDEKIDYDKIMLKNLELWSYLKSKDIIDPSSLKKDQIVRVTSKARTKDGRIMRLMKYIKETPNGLLFTDNVQDITLNNKDSQLLIYSR